MKNWRSKIWRLVLGLAIMAIGGFAMRAAFNKLNSWLAMLVVMPIAALVWLGIYELLETKPKHK